MTLSTSCITRLSRMRDSDEEMKVKTAKRQMKHLKLKLPISSAYLIKELTLPFIFFLLCVCVLTEFMANVGRFYRCER